MAELETIIQFQLIIVQNAKALKEEERMYLFRFIQEKRPHLYLIGINFEISDSNSVSVRYAKALAEITRMTPDKQTLFNALMENFINEEREKDNREEVLEMQEARNNAERQEALAKMDGEKRRKIEMLRKMEREGKLDMPIDEMPDCDTKLQQIRKNHNTKKSQNKFEDAQFSHDNETQILGVPADEVERQKRAWVITGWKRASEIPNSVLFKNGASHLDIIQGSLGDCFFLSALSILGKEGNDRIAKLFECPQDSDEWKDTGCFMVTFFKNGDLHEIIVDDWLPMTFEFDSNG